MGHMNVMWYVGKFDEATWQLFGALGITGTYLRETQSSLAAVQQNLTYKKELFAGSVVDIVSQVIFIREKVIVFAHEMRDAESGEVAATCEITAVHMDRRIRKAVPFPSRILEKIRSERCTMGDDVRELLMDVARRASAYVAAGKSRHVAALPEDIAGAALLAEAFPEGPTPASEVIRLLDEFGSPATVMSTGSRYFGYVTGGALPAALAANWLAGTWDQNTALSIMSPIGARLEEIALSWLREIFDLPVSCGAGFVTGATMANFSGLASARHALLERYGWNVEEHGLFGAPELKVVVGGEVHVALSKALSLLGFGRSRVTIVPVDDQGRMRVDALPDLSDRTIICIQAGNVNTGAVDPAQEICARAREAKAWVHVDGAFGLWAAASRTRAHLIHGVFEADSWATDCHKWLNVPYDSGIVLVRDAEHLHNAMKFSARYLHSGTTREPSFYTPEMGRRMRGADVWAALKSLGRSGLADIIDRNCTLATRFAEGLRRAGFALLNDVTLNQVLVSFGEPDVTERIIEQTQRDGTCWCGGTEWQGKTAMRISVSSWATTEDDVDQSLAAIVRIARAIRSNTVRWSPP
jgi:glutamate/tyrosine decarboxylase-like PLP-dependent enzyme/acyl-CoA thioesterase FadM